MSELSDQLIQEQRAIAELTDRWQAAVRAMGTSTDAGIRFRLAMVGDEVERIDRLSHRINDLITDLWGPLTRGQAQGKKWELLSFYRALRETLEAVVKQLPPA